MAITGAIEFIKSDDKNKSLKERLSEQDNVKDLDKKITDLDETTAANETEATINDKLEKDFDNFVLKNELIIQNFFQQQKYDSDGKEWININLKSFLDSPESEVNIYLEQLKNADINKQFSDTNIELRNLSDAIQLYFLKKDIEDGDDGEDGENGENGDDLENGDTENNPSGGEGNPFLSNKGEEKSATKRKNKNNQQNDNKETKSYELKNYYLDPYEDIGYTSIDKNKHVENIYRDNKLTKVMERIFDNEEGEELRRGTFNINLGKENGLASIIITIREAISAGTSESPDRESDAFKLYTILTNRNILHKNMERINLNFSRKDLKNLIQDGQLQYKHQGGLDNEMNKVAKILSRSQREDLDTFASLIQSKSDITMAIKEWNNTLELTGNTREHSEGTSLISSSNVLNFLCDFNSDGQIAAEYKRKNNKEQKNQGDVGTLFGSQVMFTIQQAIAVKDLELGAPKGEQLVIQNIIKNMSISDSRNLNEIHLTTMQGDSKKCTKENLSKLINGNEDDGIQAMPEMKIFFLDAIKKINGGSDVVTPDLYDTLVGKETETLISLYETEANLKAKIDEILIQSEDPKIKLIIREQGLIRVRETIITSIMTAINNVEITTNDGAKTQLQAAGITKGWEIQSLKKELLEKTIKSLILSGIHYSTTGGCRFTLGYGKEGTSESGKTKRSRGASGGLILGKGTVDLAINLSGTIAEQYNYKKVINADLSQVKSAKYLGIEGGALASIGIKNNNGVQAEAYAGINRQQDPEVGINQIDKQYRAVSEEIFDISGTIPTALSSKTAFKNYIQSRIDTEQSDSVYGEFATTNKQHLTDDLDFMVRYMEVNNFFGPNNLLTKISGTSVDALLGILQAGNIEQRRHDLIAGLHGKLEITKLAFGVTTNALTRATKNTPPPPPATIVDPLGPGLPGPTQVDPLPTGNTQEKGQDRFGLAGFYVGLRISTWKNIYVPNVAQYLFTEYETGQGIGLEEYLNNPAKDLDKYGKYLITLYNDSQKRLSYTTDKGRLILNFDPLGSGLTLEQFLNVHATIDAQECFSLRGNTLTIGNVREIGTYTITEGKGVRRILCLGTKKLDEADRVTGDSGPENVAAMEVNTMNKERTQEKLTNDIISHMSGTGKNLDMAKRETAAFFDDEGKLQTPNGYTVAFTPSTIVGLSMKENGTLTIQKNSDKNFTVSFVTTPSPDKLTITYIDQKEYIPANETIKRRVKSRPEIAIKKAFALPRNVSEVFIQSTEKELSIFDNAYKNGLYREFMESILDDELDKIIDTTNYNLAFSYLKEILHKQASVYDKLPDSFKSLINNENISRDEKIIIVDKFKTIFSYDSYLSDGKNDGSNLATLIGTRSDTYKKITGAEGMKYPLESEYRKAILENIKSEKKLNRTPVENLIGFTAFYKLNGEGRKYAMTPVGGTNVLAGSNLEKSVLTLDEGDKTKAQEWFIKNLDINSDNKKMVVEKINQLLKLKNIQIEENSLNDLIKGNKISIDSSTKISIDINRVFYLLGECANESFGMIIQKIKIYEREPEELVGIYTAKGTPEQEYTGVDVFTKNHSISNQVLTQEKRVSWKHHQKTKIRTTPPAPGPTDVDPKIPPAPGSTDVDPKI